MDNTMIELLIEDQRGNVITHQLGEGRHTLGQSPDSDIVIMDEYTSRYHADIFVNKTGVFIIDMNSTNGIWQDGKRVDKTLKMQANQPVTVGKMKLTIRVPKHTFFVKEGRKPDLGQDDPAEETAVTDDVDKKVQRILMS
jgi:pSer/pThr/pTyr-binding forkhead associated (FHA) protein